MILEKLRIILQSKLLLLKINTNIKKYKFNKH